MSTTFTAGTILVKDSSGDILGEIDSFSESEDERIYSFCVDRHGVGLFDSSELRAIADKLDELNGVKE